MINKRQCGILNYFALSFILVFLILCYNDNAYIEAGPAILVPGGACCFYTITIKKVVHNGPLFVNFCKGALME